MMFVCFLFGVLEIVCLAIGVFIGYKLSNQSFNENNNSIKVPKVNNMLKNITKLTKEEKKEREEEIERLNSIWSNINSYDGTAESQMKVEDSDD